MERSSSAFKATMRGEGFAAASGGMAKTLAFGARRNRAPSVAHRQKRRADKRGMDGFKSASLTIRRITQRFSVRHRRWVNKAWCERREAAKALRLIRWPKRVERC